MTYAEEVLIADLDVPFSTAFTKAGTMNGHPTYPIPPIPTVQGMLYAAMGRPSLLQPSSLPEDIREREINFRDRVRGSCGFGLRVLEEGTTTNGLWAKRKLTSSDGVGYIHSPSQRESIMRPSYRIYIGGPENLLNAFATALRDPQRLLYLGHSDCLVDVCDVTRTTATQITESADLDCVTLGAGDDPTLLPVAARHQEQKSQFPDPLRTVSPDGGTVDEYYQTDSGDQFVYLVDGRTTDRTSYQTMIPSSKS